MREDQKRQAFPDENNYGISMRDYFAAKAMQALIHVQVKTKQPQTALAAYEWADEMLEAREQ